ncbi:hypothetical protein D5086_007770 [Populus alba]|uniref:Uncharacterized protein n=1 Tax=Populus alba TaxID=43335 RepID=A0ACC4CFZ3_POPAL
MRGEGLWQLGQSITRRLAQVDKKPQGQGLYSFLEKLVIADVAALAPGTGTLTVFTNEKGGAIDDSVITKVQNDHMYIVVNAGCRDKDLAHIEEHMKAFKAKGGDVSWHIHDERSLLALQIIDLNSAIIVICDFSIQLKHVWNKVKMYTVRLCDYSLML